MIIQKPTKSVIKRMSTTFTEDDPVHKAFQLLIDYKVPYDCFGELLQINPERIQNSITGLEVDEMHNTFVKCITSLIELGAERGLFPCRDHVMTTELLRVLTEIIYMKKQISDLQPQQ